MEYLMTYGWAILVVLIALSSLYFLGVFSPKTPNTYFIQAPLLIQDLSIKNNGILFKMTSTLIKEAKIIDVEINGQSCRSLNGFLYNTQINGEAYTGCALDLGDYNKISGILNVIYISKSGLNHVLTGQYSGSIEGGSISEIIEQNNNGIFHLYDNNLVFGWDGESAEDYVGNSVVTENGGVNVGGVSGYLGRGTNFDGVDDYIQVTLSSVSNISKNQSMSLSFWVKRNGNGGTPQDIFEMLGGVYALEGTNPSDTAYALYWGSGATPDGSAITLSNGVWNNIVVTWSNETRNVTLTQNGVQVINTGSGSDFTLTNFFFGSRVGTMGFNGTIDEVAVWNRTLSDAEVSNLHNSYL